MKSYVLILFFSLGSSAQAEDCRLGSYRVNGRTLESCNYDSSGHPRYSAIIRNVRLSLFLEDYALRNDSKSLAIKRSFLLATGETSLPRYIQRLNERSASYDYDTVIEAKSEEQLRALKEFVEHYNQLSPLLQRENENRNFIRASHPPAMKSFGVSY